MKKRWIAVLLCAALLAAFGWGQPRISGEGETYDLYFLEADLSDAPGGDALRRSRCTSSRARCGTPGSWRSIW